MSDGWDEVDGGADDRAPICPACGVTALPADDGHVLDTRWTCENPDCDSYGEIIG